MRPWCNGPPGRAKLRVAELSVVTTLIGLAIQAVALWALLNSAAEKRQEASEKRQETALAQTESRLEKRMDRLGNALAEVIRQMAEINGRLRQPAILMMAGERKPPPT